MRWTLWQRKTGVAGSVRQKRVVLVSRRWIKSAEAIPPATVAKEPVHRGEHAISRSTIAQETPDCSVNLW